jgi:hypothetical protein
MTRALHAEAAARWVLLYRRTHTGNLWHQAVTVPGQAELFHVPA